MAPVKRRPHGRSHPKMSTGRRKPRISQLVYKYLNIGEGKKGVVRKGALASPGRCRFCHRLKLPHGEVFESVDSRAADRMANKRKDSSRSSKSHQVKRRQIPKDQAFSSCMHKVAKGEGVRKMREYIQKAIDFGVESGYLIPKDAAYRVLRVSSDLMRDTNYKIRKHEAMSPRRTPIRFEDYEVQDARRRRSRRRRRRSRRRRRRSGSRRRRRSRRRRGRRRSGSADDEVVEVDNEEYENDKGEKRKNVDTAKRDDDNEQINQSDEEKAANKKDDDGTEMSMDEEDSEDDEEDNKKREDTTKS